MPFASATLYGSSADLVHLPPFGFVADVAEVGEHVLPAGDALLEVGEDADASLRRDAATTSPPPAPPPPPIGTPPPPPPCGRNGGVPQPPAAPPGIGPPPVPPNTGTAPMPSKPPSPPSIPPLPPGPAPPPANVTFWPVNMYISVAATRDVTTSLMAVRSAVLRELPMAFHTDCDLVRSASNTPPACCLSESKICRLCSRTNCVVRLAAFSRAARIAASLASSPWSRISWRCPFNSSMRALISSALYFSRVRVNSSSSSIRRVSMS